MRPPGRWASCCVRATASSSFAIAHKITATTRCGSTERVEVHHVRALADGGHPRGPVALLCFRCHVETRDTSFATMSVR
jgi:hypothetical protein